MAARRPARLVLALVLLGTVYGFGVAAAEDAVIPAGREAEVVKLVAPYELGGEVAEGFRLDDIRIGQREIELVLEQRGEPGERVTLALRLRSTVRALVGAVYDLSIEPPEEQQSLPARRAAAQLRAVVVQNADRAFWASVLRSGAESAPSAPSRPALAFLGAFCVVLGIALVCRRTQPREGAPVWPPWTAYAALAATVVLVSIALWSATRTFGIDDPAALARHREAWQRECARGALWAAFGACAAACIATVMRAAATRRRAAVATWAPIVADAAAVLLWSAIVRFVLTTPNILTDGGSGYGRLWRMHVGGYQGFGVLVETVFSEPRFMWTVIRLPWALAALAPPLLLLLARALGFGRVAALLAGIALASLPLHAAMYSSDFELGPVLTFVALGLALVAAGLRRGRDELAAAGAAVLAYVCWCRPEGQIVGAALLAVAAPALVRWRRHAVVVGALGWFLANAAASFASTRALGGGGQFCLDHPLQSEIPLLTFLTLQPVVPFWLLLPLPFGVARLVRNDRWRLGVIGVGIAAGLLPLSVTALCHADRTHSYMEFFRYGTWALPWLVLLAAEGMEACVVFAARRVERDDAGRARRVELAATATIAVVCMATPVVFRGYLARQYGPRVEEAAFRKALRRIPAGCGVVVPDDASDDQSGGTIEIMQRYVYVAEEAAARHESDVDPKGIVGGTAFLRAAERDDALPRLPPEAVGNGDGGATPCWYYFHGSYCATGLFGDGSAVCAELEQRASLAPVLAQRIFYVSHRLVTRPDLRDPPLYDPAQPIVLSKIVGWRPGGTPAAAVR